MTNLTSPIPIRCDPATLGNLETIINTGIAANNSAAFRAAAAALARGLVGDPRIWRVSIYGHEARLFGTRAAAVAWLRGQGAQESNDGSEWITLDEDGNPFTHYTLEAVALE